MSEKRVEVRSIKVSRRCENDDCAGFMKPAGKIALMTDPPLFPHECDICKIRRNYSVIYPRFEYEEVEEINDYSQSGWQGMEVK